MNVFRDAPHPARYEQLLRDELIRAIASVHPPGHRTLSDVSLCHAAQFFELFDSVSTLNHDFLSYWSIMHLFHRDQCIEGGHAVEFSDGFGRAQPHSDPDGPLIFIKWRKRRHLRFLHGALHLFQMGTTARKLKRGPREHVPERFAEFLIPGEDLSLWHQLLIELSAGNAPLAIVGPTSPAKLAQIQANRYLSRCFQEFSTLRGNLIIYGASLSLQDQHVLQAIAQNPNLEKLYVGVYCGATPAEACDLIGRVCFSLESYDSQVSPVFFDSGTVPMWRPPSRKVPYALNCGERIDRAVRSIPQLQRA